jgi:type VI secretion system secreted protein VgrG
MSATQEHRSVQLTTPFGKDVLLFSSMTASERISQPFQFRVSALSENGTLDGDKILGQPVSIEVRSSASGKVERVFHGFVSDFTQASYGERHHEYELTMRPWFWLLSRTADCRIYQNLTVREIFESLAKEKGFSDFRFDLRLSYDKLLYCVQYRETAFNFLSRLLEQEGIYYYFEHSSSKHTMVLTDDTSSLRSVDGYSKVPYYPPTEAASRRERDHLTSWTCVATVQPGSYTTDDFDFKSPKKTMRKTASAPFEHANAKGVIFDYPAEVAAKKDDERDALESADHVEAIAGLRLGEFRAAHAVAHGHGDALGLTAGRVFTLYNFPREDRNIKYVIVAADYTLTSEGYESGGGQGAEFDISIEAIDARVDYVPPRVTPKPVVQGAQTAIVVGKSGAEIDTDRWGRVKVQFHWDHKGASDETSSCRLRVASTWAGQQWGAIQIPRIGQEVVVSFLEGDPDRPLITGSVYNGHNMPPYTLPDNATQSGIKSRSSAKGSSTNFNEIRFEDKKGSEELCVHAEKDYKVDVENDATWRVGLKEKSPAKSEKGLAKLLVGKKLEVDVGDEITFVTGESKIVMKKNGDIAITCKNLSVKATQKIELKADQEVDINGQQQVNVKSLKIAAEGTTGVEIKGLKVAIQGNATVEIKGNASTKVEGVAMLDLSASGIASLKGALTKIG